MDHHAALRVFVKVAELQSFTRAAEQLAIPRATATTTIQDLEALVHAKLLNRTTRSVSLTPDGAAFLERSKDLLSDLDDMVTMFRAGDAELSGKIRVDMASSLANEVVIPQLAKFIARHPRIEVEILGTDRKVDLIRESIDCTIRGGPVEPGLAAIDLDLGEVVIVNAASPSYLARYGVPKRLEDLAHHRLIQFASSFGQPPDTFDWFDGEKTRQVRMKSLVTVSSIDGYKAAALAGLGICQNPRVGIRQHLKSGKLVEVLPRFRPEPGRTARIVYPQRRFLAKRVRAFIEWVTPVLQAHFAEDGAARRK
ncbi:MAG: LysR family transcriptional regulator [Myxococcaceae bacterium]